ncbi:helix-turn-helix domain-containing protein [Bacillus mycoides]|uniref:helix-turn-helix domain-containing protein n=1 Tax=Bacillus mycoides TaxID=1405 RepID=UPI0016432C8A|nr:S24 family peptidase [Bacillus mycoides]
MSTETLKEFGFYLKKIREEKKLSLRKVSELSSVSNAYLSQLENGKRGIPSPDILKKISQVLGVEYSELMNKAGYIDLHDETVSLVGNSNLERVITSATEIFIKSVTNVDGRIEENFKNFIIDNAQKLYQIDRETIANLVDEPGFLNELVSKLSLEERIYFLDIIVRDCKEKNINASSVFETASIYKTNTVSTIRVPVLGHIAAGLPIAANEQIEEYMDISNQWNLNEGEAIVLRVKGDSMIGSRIFEGDKVVVRLQPEVENGEIAVVNVDGDEATLKRVRKSANGQVILYPDNPNYEPIIIAHERARIIGKVIQVMFEPR